jgi:hypothetical protein
MVEKRQKTATLNLRIHPKLKEAAERAASEDHRSVTSLIEKLLSDHLKATGHLPADGPKASGKAKRK